MDINYLARDIKAREVGEWVDNLEGLHGVKLKVKGLTSDAFTKYYADRVKDIPLWERETNGNIKGETAVKIFQDGLSEVILIDWEGLESNGEPLPYTKELAKSYIDNPAFEVFRDAITLAAKIVDNKRLETGKKPK